MAFALQIEKLITAYRQLAVKEKNERDRSKYVRKRNYNMLVVSRDSILLVSCHPSRSNWHTLAGGVVAVLLNVLDWAAPFNGPP